MVKPWLNHGNHKWTLVLLQVLWFNRGLCSKTVMISLPNTDCVVHSSSSNIQWACTVVVIYEHVVLTWGLVWLWKLGHRVLKAGEFGLHYPKSFCKPDLLSFEELLHLPQHGHHSVLIHTTLKNKPRTSSSATNRAPGYNLMASSYRLMIDLLHSKNTTSPRRHLTS